MQIDFTAGKNFSSAPAGLKTVLTAIASFYDSVFRNSVTLDITVNWEPLTSSTPGGITLASNNINTGGVTESYSTVVNALEAHAQSTIQNQADQTLPSSDPFFPGTNTFWIAPAQAEALGLKSGVVKSNLSINSTQPWSYTLGSTSSGNDLFGTIGHEITELAMGRVGSLGTESYSGSSLFDSNYTILDLFRYFPTSGGPSTGPDPAAGTSTGNSTAGFSVNAGATILGTWNNDSSNGYDLADWVIKGFPDPSDTNGDPAGVPNDAYGAGSGPISEVDLELMKVLGWNVAVVVNSDTQTVTSGQTLSDYYVLSGGALVVDKGGVAFGTYYTNANEFNDGTPGPGTALNGANSAGYGYISGTEIDAAVNAGGWEIVVSGGVASNTAIFALGLGEIAAGGSALKASVYIGGSQQIDSGGVAISATVYSGGLQDDSGTALSTDVLGSQTVEFGGTASGGSVDSGGSQTVEFGGTASGGSIDSGGLQDVSGTAVSTTLYGSQTVEFAATANFTRVYAGPTSLQGLGGTETVLRGGTTVSTTAKGGGSELISAGGVAKNTILSSGGVEVVSAGGSANNTIVYAGGMETVSGTDIGAKVSGGIIGGKVVSGVQIVVGVASDGAVYARGVQTVHGSAVSTTVYQSGQQVVIGFAGTANGTTVSNGGVQSVSGDGLASGTQIKHGGSQVIASGGYAENTVISAGGKVSLGGVDSNSTVLSGGTETVDDGGYASATQIQSGGKEDVSYGGMASGTVIKPGGSETVHGTDLDAAISGGLIGGKVVSGIQVVSGAPATIIGPSRPSGAQGAALPDVAGSSSQLPGVASGGAIYDRGVQIVFGSAVSTTVYQGGQQIVSGGAASATTLSQGGTQEVDAYGVALGTQIGYLGSEIVSSLGYSSDTTVSSGGTQYLSDGEADATMAVGGLQFVLFGGIASGGEFSSGAREVIHSGGEAIGTTVLRGGEDVVLSGGSALNTSVGSGAGESVGSNGQRGGYASGTIVGAGGKQLVLSGGTATGTTISGTSAAQFVDTSGTSISAAVAQGGTETISSHGVASNTTISSGGLEVVSHGGMSVDTVIAGGTLDIKPGGSVGAGLSFSGSGGTYEIDTATVIIPGTISSFASGDTIDLREVAFNPFGSATLDAASNLLTVREGSAIYTLQFDPGQNFSGEIFKLAADGSGATDITLGTSGPSNVWTGGVTAEFTTGANWSAAVVPVDTGTFTNNGAPTSVTISASATIGELLFTAGAPAYGFSIDNVNFSNPVFAINGSGIVNNSAFLPTFTVNAGPSGQSDEMAFDGSSSAGDATIDLPAFQTAPNDFTAGVLIFNNSSTADGATITAPLNGGGIDFDDSSSAGNATISVAGSDMEFSGNSTADKANITSLDSTSVVFSDSASAGSATLTANNNAEGSGVTFEGNSSAGDATIINNNDAQLLFTDSTTADAATITNNAATFFDGNATAGTATITNEANGGVYFKGNATGGQARIINDATGSVDFSDSTGPAGNGHLTAGSIEGAGDYLLGADQLTVGGNNRSTTVSGVIADGGTGGTGGSLVKLGTGTLTLDAANTYTGGTTIEGNSTLELGESDAAGSAAITFGAGTSDTLQIDGTTMPTNVVSGFVPGDTVDLRGVAFDSAGTVTLGTANLLQISENGQSYDLHLDPAQNFGGEAFALTADGHGGTALTLGSGGPIIVSSGQDFFVSSGQTEGPIVVLSGGRVDVLSGGTADVATISGGGREVVSGGGSAVSTTLLSGATLEIQSGGTNSAFIWSAGTLQLDTGVTSVALVAGGGQILDLSGGVESGGTFAASGGVELVDNGGLAVSTIVGSGGSQQVLPGGSASAPSVLSGGSQTIDGGGVAVGTTIAQGGSQTVISNGVAVSTTVGGTELVYPGGTTSDTTVTSGGRESLGDTGFPGGVAVSTTVDSAGSLVVWNQGVASDTILNSGNETVSAGGLDSGGTVSAGGVLTIRGDVGPFGADYANSDDTTILSGGYEYVESNGIATGAVIDGGLLDVGNGGSIGGDPASLSFAPGAGGTFRVDAPAGPATYPYVALISGFGGPDIIDVTFMSDGPALSMSVQTVDGGRETALLLTSGGTTVGFTFNGAYSSGQFALAPDNLGGTQITDPPLLDIVSSTPSVLVAAPGQTILGGASQVIDFSHLTAATGGAVLADAGSPYADTVIGFTDGVDHLSFAGENTATEAAVAASAQIYGGNTILTYADHSAITLIGVTHVDTGIFA